MPSTSQIQWTSLTKSVAQNGKPRLACVDVQHPPSETPVDVLPWTCRSEGKRRSRQTGRQSNPHKRSASWKVWSVEELETLPAGTKPRIPHPWWPTGERHGNGKHSMMITERMRESSHTNVVTVLTAAVGTFKFGEMVWSTYGHSACIALYIILNWTERNWRSGRNWKDRPDHDHNQRSAEPIFMTPLQPAEFVFNPYSAYVTMLHLPSFLPMSHLCAQIRGLFCKNRQWKKYKDT